MLLLIIKLLLLIKIYTTSHNGALCAGGTTDSRIWSSLVNLHAKTEGALAARALEGQR